MRNFTDADYKSDSKRIYSRLIRKGMYAEASRLLRALVNGVKVIHISLCDTDWNLASEFCGASHLTNIKIQ